MKINDKGFNHSASFQSNNSTNSLKGSFIYGNNTLPSYTGSLI